MAKILEVRKAPDGYDIYCLSIRGEQTFHFTELPKNIQERVDQLELLYDKVLEEPKNIIG